MHTIHCDHCTAISVVLIFDQPSTGVKLFRDAVERGGIHERFRKRTSRQNDSATMKISPEFNPSVASRSRNDWIQPRFSFSRFPTLQAEFVRIDLLEWAPMSMCATCETAAFSANVIAKVVGNKIASYCSSGSFHLLSLHNCFLRFRTRSSPSTV